MELILNNGFYEMSQDEMIYTDGGSVSGWIILGVICLVFACTTKGCSNADKKAGNR